MGPDLPKTVEVNSGTEGSDLPDKEEGKGPVRREEAARDKLKEAARKRATIKVQQAIKGAIVDELRVPSTLGKFVLRWRWDTEQNPQIWTHCADVEIVAK